MASIKIIQQDDTIAFLPDVKDAQTGQPLGVKQGDSVTWNNNTPYLVELKAIEPPGLPMPAPIERVSQILNVPNEGLTYSSFYSEGGGVSQKGPDHSIVVVKPPKKTAFGSTTESTP